MCTEKAKEIFNEIWSMVQDRRKERTSLESALNDTFIEDVTDSSHHKTNGWY